MVAVDVLNVPDAESPKSQFVDVSVLPEGAVDKLVKLSAEPKQPILVVKLATGA